MVSRVESDQEGNQNWQFVLNVMPKTEVYLVDLNPGGKIKILSVLCMTDNSRTVVSDVIDPVFLDTGVLGEDACYTPVANLYIGDPHYLTNVYSSELERQVEVRISHQNKF